MASNNITAKSSTGQKIITSAYLLFGIFFLFYLIDAWVHLPYSDATRNDFGAFYVGGLMWRHGFYSLLYNHTIQTHFHNILTYPHKENSFYFLSLPILAWFSSLFTYIPYMVGFYIWSSIEWIAIILSGVLVYKTYQGITPKGELIARILCFLFGYATFITIFLGQVNGISIFLFALYLYLDKKGKSTLGIYLLTFMGILIKFQVILGILLLFVLQKRKNIQPIILGLISVVLLSLLTTGFTANLAFVKNIFTTIHGTPSYKMFGIVNLAGFLFGSHYIIGTIIIFILCTTLLIFVMKKYYCEENKFIIFSAFFFYTIFLSPHLLLYDYIMLFFPFLWLSITYYSTRKEKWVLLSWIFLNLSFCIDLSKTVIRLHFDISATFLLAGIVILSFVAIQKCKYEDPAFDEKHYE